VVLYLSLAPHFIAYQVTFAFEYLKLCHIDASKIVFQTSVAQGVATSIAHFNGDGSNKTRRINLKGFTWKKFRNNKRRNIKHDLFKQNKV